LHHQEQNPKFLNLETPEENIAIDRQLAEKLLPNFNTILAFSKKSIRYYLENRTHRATFYATHAKKSAEKPSKWFEFMRTNRQDSFALEWDLRTLKTKNTTNIRKQLIEFIYHLIPSVQETINSQPMPHGSSGTSSTIPPI